MLDVSAPLSGAPPPPPPMPLSPALMLTAPLPAAHVELLLTPQSLRREMSGAPFAAATAAAAADAVVVAVAVAVAPDVVVVVVVVVPGEGDADCIWIAEAGLLPLLFVVFGGLSILLKLLARGTSTGGGCSGGSG